MRGYLERFLKPNNLSLKLMRVVFTLYLIVTLIVTLGQMWAEFVRTQNDIVDELAVLGRTLYKPVATSIWQMNQLQLEALGQGLISMSTIEGVDVLDASKQSILTLRSFTEGNAPFQLFSIEKELKWTLNNEEIYLGVMRLYSSSSIVFDRIFFGFALIAIGVVIKFFILWALFLWAFKRFLEHPLNSLMKQINDIKLERIGENRISLGIEETNELVRLQDHVNLMLNTITIEKEALLNTEKERRIWLEKEVALRTRDLSEVNKKLALLASTDALTNISNHRTFYEQAQIRMDLSIRQQVSFSFLVMDIDLFKNINDRYGHSIGDQVLCHFVQEVEKGLRKTDLFGRVGGEEFAILLSDTDLDAAIIWAKKMCRCVEETSVLSDKGEIKLTVSIGVCCKESGDTDIHQIFKRSDALLYAAKGNGRNRVEPST